MKGKRGEGRERKCVKPTVTEKKKRRERVEWETKRKTKRGKREKREKGYQPMPA